MIERQKSRIPVKRLLNRVRAYTNKREARWMCTDADVAALEDLVERADWLIHKLPPQDVLQADVALYRAQRSKFPA